MKRKTLGEAERRMEKHASFDLSGLLGAEHVIQKRQRMMDKQRV